MLTQLCSDVSGQILTQGLNRCLVSIDESRAQTNLRQRLDHAVLADFKLVSQNLYLLVDIVWKVNSDFANRLSDGVGDQ